MHPNPPTPQGIVNEWMERRRALMMLAARISFVAELASRYEMHHIPSSDLTAAQFREEQFALRAIYLEIRKHL